MPFTKLFPQFKHFSLQLLIIHPPKIARLLQTIPQKIGEDTLLMIAIAVVASLVVYAWVTGYIGGTTTKASNSMLIQSASHTTDNFLIVYVQNVGQGTLELNQGASVYVNSVLKSITVSTPAISAAGKVSFPPGTTASLTTNYSPYTGKEKLKIKITATDGTFAEYTTSGLSTVAVGTFPAWPTASFTMSISNPTIGQSVTFTDTSVKGDGTINQWSWNFGDGATSSVQNPTHSYSSLGTKTVTLTVTDSASRIAIITQTLIVIDYASPTASFTWTPTNPAVNSAVTFTDTSTASGSATITQWSWNFGTGSSPATSTSHTPSSLSYSSSGQKTVSLTITDSNGKTSTTTRLVNVGTTTIAPTAEFTISNSNPNVGQSVTFTDVSTDSSGTINQWSWSFGDGTTSTVQNPTHSYTTQGIKTVTLTVTDSLSHTSTATHTIDVNDYAPPLASFTYAPTTIATGQTVTFTDASTAGSGTINQWSWNFGSGATPTTSTTQSPSASFATAGQQTVSLTVTDSNSKTSTTTQTLTINSPTPTGQVALIITTPATATAGSAFSATITARDESGNLLTNYASTITFTSSDSQAILPGTSTLTAGTGTFSVTLKTVGSETITVSDGTETSTSGIITVNPAPATKLIYTAGTSQSITISDVSSVITVQRQDQYGNPSTTGALTVTLASTSGNGLFYSNSAGTTRITTVTIADGSSSANFYYMDSNTGTPTLTASSSGITSATTQFTINTNLLVYTGGAPQTLPTGTMSSTITIERQTTTGSHYSTGAITVALSTSSSTGAFYATQTSTTPLSPAQVSIANGAYSATFYYKDTAQGTPKITVSAAGYSPASTTFIITGPATQLKFTAGTSQSIYTGQVSSVITVAQQDSSGNGINAAATLTVNLTATSTTGAFYNNAQGTGTPITQVTIARGSSSASFYFKDTIAGSSTITASSTGLTSATTTLTIVQNLVSDGGFDQSGSNSPWKASGSGYASNHETSDTAPSNWGAYSELETVPPGYSGTGSGILTSTFSPAVAISTIPNAAGSLSMQIYNTGYLQATGYYSFQIILTASDGSQLIYWWGNNPATAPTQTSTVKVINLGTIQGTFTAGQWILFSRPLRADWTNAGLSSSATLASIALQCNGYHTGNSQYGQEIFIDNVAIQ
jgi:PKD repeat protein